MEPTLTCAGDNSDGKNAKITATLDEAMLLSGFGIFNIVHMIMSGLMLMGMITLSLVLGFVIPAAQCDLELTMFQKSWLSAIPFAAIIVSSYFWGWIADTKGRRPSMLVSMVLSIIGTLLTSFAPNLISFAILQFITGIFTTGPSAIVYTYLGECNNIRHRDKMVTFGSSFIGLGNVFLPCVAWIILPLDFSYPLDFLDISYRSWRLCLVVCSLPYVLASIFLAFALESPKFLYANGKHDEALEVVKTMYAVNSRKSRDSFPVKSLIVENQVTKLNEHKGVRAVFASMKEQTFPIFTPPLLQWICLTCFVHFGIFAATNGFYIWFPTILNSLALSDSTNMKICDVIESQVEVAAEAITNTTVICDDTIHTSTFEQSIYVSLAFYSMYFIAGALVDFLGKKLLLVATLVVTGMCGVGAHLAADQTAAVILFGIFQMSGACIGLVNAAGVELFPTKYRAMAICLSMMVGRTGAVVGSNLIGWFLQVNCGAGFYLFGFLLVVDGLVCLALPNKKKEKSTPLPESVPRPVQEA
ncbi:organic cation/carnitine transporter 7-like [Trichoplusia ni]|uniref:Organic cation/carnitine transporter 7-like n=1 Tax=Trichoplusia ni TaxID=7111 RepID=A0A7E5X4W0_TRINI|nr:organic cation/carnitine transporter 7-like [Trichoplusia ni]XP_026747522.1 organic cation/carnitine transporter 7-like [Trichoplusia ni]